MNAALDVRPRFIVDAKGRKKAVVIPFDAYEKLMEDLSDLAAAAERREEPTVPHEQLRYMPPKLSSSLSASGIGRKCIGEHRRVGKR